MVYESYIHTHRSESFDVLRLIRLGGLGRTPLGGLWQLVGGFSR